MVPTETYEKMERDLIEQDKLIMTLNNKVRIFFFLFFFGVDLF